MVGVEAEYYKAYNVFINNSAGSYQYASVADFHAAAGVCFALDTTVRHRLGCRVLCLLDLGLASQEARRI